MRSAHFSCCRSYDWQTRPQAFPIEELYSDDENDEVIFQQDGASPHTARATQAWLETQEYQFIRKEDWPARSPDLNIIERLWAIMQQRVDEKEPRTKDGLVRIVKRIWRALQAEALKNLVASMDARLQAVIDHDGEYLRGAWY